MEESEHTSQTWQDMQHVLTHLNDRLLRGLVIWQWVDWLLGEETYWSYIEPLSLWGEEMPSPYDGLYVLNEVLPLLGYTFCVHDTICYPSLDALHQNEGEDVAWDAVAPTPTMLRTILSVMTAEVFAQVVYLAYFYYGTYSTAALRDGLIPDYAPPPQDASLPDYLLVRISEFCVEAEPPEAPVNISTSVPFPQM